MTNQRIEFSYTYSPQVLVALSALCALAVAIFSFLAFDNDRGLIIQRAIHLGVEGATRLYWAMASFGTLGFVFFGAILLTRGRFPRRIALEAAYLLAPTSRWPFSMYEQVVRYNAIRGFQTFTVSRMKTLRILHTSGKVEIDAIRFHSKAAFLEFCNALEERTNAARAPGTKSDA
jgi:hypothetical protein